MKEEGKCRNCNAKIGYRKGKKWCGDKCRKQFAKKSKIDTTQSNNWVYKGYTVNIKPVSQTQGTLELVKEDNKVAFDLAAAEAYKDDRKQPYFKTDEEIKRLIDFVVAREPRASKMAKFYGKPLADYMAGPDAQFEEDYAQFIVDSTAVKKPEETIEIEMPNSEDDFDNAVMDALDPPADWLNNVIKQRVVKKQIFDAIKGGSEEERKAATEKIYKKFYDKELAGKAEPLEEDYYSKLEKATTEEERRQLFYDELNKSPYSTGQYGGDWSHRYYVIPKGPEGSKMHLTGRGEAKHLVAPESQEEAWAWMDEHGGTKIVEAYNNISAEKKPEKIETINPLESSEKIDISVTPKKKREFYEVNKSIETLIDQKGDSEYSPEEKAFIAQYSGYGGLIEYMGSEAGDDTKILFEFFTPQEMVKRMWGLAYKYGYDGGPVFEPSAGTGAFLQYAPRNAKIDAVELNPYSAKILKILYPNVNVIQGKFENQFIVNRKSVKDKVEAKYDLVIGNPPFGRFSGTEAAFEKKYTDADRYEEYFMSRSLDLLKPGGLLIFVIGTPKEIGGIPFLDKKINKAKKEIQSKSKLIDAYRLPNGVFDRTNVSSDIIVLRKK